MQRSVYRVWCAIAILVAAGRMVEGAAHPMPSNTAKLQCSNQFTLYNSNCYRYFGDQTKCAYFHAQKQCRRYQGTLVSIHSSDEEEFILALTDRNSSFWIGLNDHDGPGSEHKEGVFKWGIGESDGGYVNWRLGEPKNKQHVDCVWADKTGWAMASGGCALTKLPFICKRIACPEGLALYQGLCDVIISQQTSPITQSVHYLALLFLFVLTAVSITCLVTCKRLRSNVTTKNKSSEDKRQWTSLAVHDLYPT